MPQKKSDLPVSDERLKKIRRYIEGRAPLVPKGYKIVVDEKAVECLLPKAIAATGPFWGGLIGAKDREDSLSPEQLSKLKGTLIEQFNSAAGCDLPFDAAELDKEAAETKRTLVMAGPEKITKYYSREEKIQIYREWLCARHALVKAGAHLEVLTPAEDKGGFREVYTRDRYVMIGDTAYLPDPDVMNRMHMHPSDRRAYKGEIEQIKQALQERGVKTVTVKDAWFEGGNAVRHYSSRTIFVGLEHRTTRDCVQRLVNAINETQQEKWSGLAVPLTNYPEMYHMDTGMSEELSHGEVMLSPLLTDRDTYQKILDIVGPKNVIELTNDEARNLATNMIDVGDTIIMTGVCRDLGKKLAGRGYKVISPDAYGQKDFEFGGGGVHCMTNDVRSVRPKRPASHAP